MCDGVPRSAGMGEALQAALGRSFVERQLEFVGAVGADSPHGARGASRDMGMPIAGTTRTRFPDLRASGDSMP